MKSFQFTLQSLRVLRGQKERAAQQRYAEALRACETAAGQVKLASDALSSSWTTLSQALSTGAPAMELLRTRAWCNVLELRLKERAGCLEKARLAVDAVWREMLAATCDREAMDRYYDKSRRAYEHQLLLAEQKHFDELATQMNNAPGPLQYSNPSP